MKIKLSQLFLEDGPYGYARLSFAGRPDDTGIRGGKKIPKTRFRGNDFPFDLPTHYGDSQAYDRGSIGGAGSINHALTPKDTTHTALNKSKDELPDPDHTDEAMGSPSSPGRGNSSAIGSSVPGSGGSWSNNPPKDWDEDDDKKFDRYDEGPLTIDPRPPDIEITPNPVPPYHRDQTDDDLENRLNRYWGGEDNLNFLDPNADAHVLASDPFGVVFARLSSRGQYGMMPNESSWDRADKARRHMYSKRREISDEDYEP